METKALIGNIVYTSSPFPSHSRSALITVKKAHQGLMKSGRVL